MSETRKDDMLICERLGRCPTPIACSNPYECRDAKRAATPPTPDRDAVRALTRVLRSCDAVAFANLAVMYGVNESKALADALLRPAPLPADVRAAVERVESAMARRRGLVAGGVKRDTKCIVASDQVAVSDVAALLAHLTREAR